MNGHRCSNRSFARVTLSGMVCAGICAYLAWMLMETKSTTLDATFLRFVVEHRTGWLTGTMRLVTWLGSRWVLGPLVIAVGGLFLLSRRDWRPGSRLVAALVGALGLQELLGRIVARPRPPSHLWIEAYTGPSFPSLHATMTIAVYGMLSAILSCNQSHRTRTLIWSLTGLVTLIVGASRVYLGAHWLTDVLGGYALGAAWLSFLVALMSLVGTPPEHP
jgi:undecaprenyl-diphosphatase